MTTDITKIENYLNEIRIPLRLACMTESGWPRILSLWFFYQDGQLYCATQKSAWVVTYLQNNPRCAFEIAADQPPYCGVRGQVIARIDENIGLDVLEKLIQRYLGGTDNSLAKNLLGRKSPEVAIILKPEKIFTWDFSSRMQDVPSIDPKKVCL